MYSLHRYKIVLLLVVLATGLSAQSTVDKSYNYLDFKSKGVYYGIALGLNNSSFTVRHSNRFILNDSIGINQANAQPGLTFQGIFNLKLGQYFDFRVLAGFSISERNLSYYKPGEVNPYRNEKIEFVYADIPIMVRYKSAPYRDKRVFVIGGLKYSYDVNGFARRQDGQKDVTVVPHDFSLEVGAGMQFFFPFFILSPEVKMSQGIGNILSYNNELNESRVIDKLLTRTFTITFSFEG